MNGWFSIAIELETPLSNNSFCSHHDLLKLYQSQKKSSQVSLDDLALVKQHFQFVRDDEADREQFHDNWVIRMSIAYYQRLFREYAIVDLRFYKENRIGMRWRTEMEVLQGKGQFVCANKTCKEASGLHSYEVLFRYKEEDQVKRCLVKIRVCEDCALKFFYRKLKRKRKEMKKLEAVEFESKTASPKSSKKRKLTTRVEDSVAISDVHAMCSAVHQESKDEPPGNEDEENQSDAGHQKYLTELFL
uniref:Uncharacterized protein AlNc14C115G6516 n=1 Tax=Albugo laibachii Nc14 TaxID=890382 RepID=F0WIY0_9STRA|nr:conserved hypothetical protein [Albugo laibachii Nc14]|eukprot:CCA21226.1 conserved hypothetical protein [Albugo laibachii Nc14]